MTMKRLFFSAIAPIALLGALAAPAVAQSSMAVLDFQAALTDTAEIKKEAEKLEAKYGPKRQRLESLSQELQDIQAKLQSATGQAALDLQADGQRKQREAQRLNEDLQADIEFDRNAILQRAGQRMRDVINALAAERGYDLIVDVQSVFFRKDALDITPAVTAAYDAKHPVAP